MSIADRLLPARGARARGFTALEMVITTAIFGLTTLVIERTISSVTESERTMRAIRQTADRCQQVTYELRDAVAGARKLYQGDAVGNAYLAKLALPTAAPMLAGSRLPIFDETKSLGPDTDGSPKTGNVLLFVRDADPLPCTSVAATKKTALVDAYRFVCVYLTPTTRTLVTGGPVSLDLAEWRSELFPSYAQVMAIPNATERAKVVKDLYDRFNVDYLWDLTKPVTSAFYAIDGVGNVGATPTSPTSIPEDLNVSERGHFVRANLGVARTDMTSKLRQPVFTVEAPATWTPHGFEVKIAAPSGARRVWLRLTIEQQAGKGRVPAHQTTIVANTRDT
jgi:type II secretory pathway pseudopilin PulG